MHKNLHCADLSGADLHCADLSGADLSGADLRGANLSGADLSASNLRGANMSRADMSRADMRGADMRRAIMCGADLSGADLCGADLRGADLWKTKFDGAGLRGTCLLRVGEPAAARWEFQADRWRLAGGEFDHSTRVVYGYRARHSLINGTFEYTDGGAYSAPLFSFDESTPHHPGLYICASPTAYQAFAALVVPDEVIRVVAAMDHTIVVDRAIARCRSFAVIGGI